MNNFLDKIREVTTKRLLNYKIDELREQVINSRKPHEFLNIFYSSHLDNSTCIIAEIKFSSPAKGCLKNYYDVANLAKLYLENGAQAISVVTEPTYFKGSLQYLEQVRKVHPRARLLMKDFIIDEKQLLQARIHGADAVLLIASLLSEIELKTLYTQAINYGLTPLIEVHTKTELELAYGLGAKLIGINNRNLHSLHVDITTSILLSQIKKDNCFFISESGIDSSDKIIELQKLGFNGYLIGSHFMTANCPGAALDTLLREISHAS